MDDPVIVHEILNAVVPGVIAIVLLLPVVKALVRRFERKPVASADLAAITASLQRLELAVDTMAVEVERIAEAQRFSARLEPDRQPARELKA